ncbi:MAG: sensor histidine kinase, partial [Thermoflexales bacterium]|nr:sensor histidine kinase [Thermoflexales bacterium]
GAALPKAIPPQLGFPLHFQNQARGVWVVEPHQGENLADADVRILETLARQAETSLGKVLLVETLRRQLAEIRASRETLAQAQHQLLRSREEERARLARELHDGPLQALVGINLQLSLLLPPEDQDHSPLAETIAEMRAQVRGLLVDLRQVCAELRPPMLDMLGLGAALQALADEWSSQNDVPLSLDLPADATPHSLRSLPVEVEINLYRVAQEALANVARHAAARHVCVSLLGIPDHLTLSIKDDGRGFAMPPTLGSLTAHGHFGLVGMQERVNLIGGQLALESFPGRGTTVRVTWQTTNDAGRTPRNQEGA